MFARMFVHWMACDGREDGGQVELGKLPPRDFHLKQVPSGIV